MRHEIQDLSNTQCDATETHPFRCTTRETDSYWAFPLPTGPSLEPSSGDVDCFTDVKNRTLSSGRRGGEYTVGRLEECRDTYRRGKEVSKQVGK